MNVFHAWGEAQNASNPSHLFKLQILQYGVVSFLKSPAKSTPCSERKTSLTSMQAAKQPHKDISDQEAERAVRLSEHLLYIQRQQRALLKQGAEGCAHLMSCMSAIQGFQPAPELGSSRSWKIDQVCFPLAFL